LNAAIWLAQVEAPVEAFTDVTSGGTTDGGGGAAVADDFEKEEEEDVMSDGGVLTVREKAAFEAKYPYAFLDDNPYVISQHVHDPAKVRARRYLTHVQAKLNAKLKPQLKGKAQGKRERGKATV
jgi:hypothetical protein